jgi:hypothetical protein
MTLPTLDDRLRALSDALAHAQPPETVDRSVAAAIGGADKRRMRAAAPIHAWERWLAWPLALAASMFAISFVVRQAPADERSPALAADTLQRVGETFVPVVAREVLEQAGDAYVISARLPRTTLAELGLPVHPERIGEAVDAELLVRPDGALLALRFVN